ncbi:hypothetical protein JCGZ_06902 [Jatropha curcas]|uniref:Uncharacterized protein n=1 Tax=Jatropha curcas TaxID=180498 RepID=A0A067L0R3_JATCU|nr:hypothetical protein JCGZ_06902 [Jatropha curcas]
MTHTRKKDWQFVDQRSKNTFEVVVSQVQSESQPKEGPANQAQLTLLRYAYKKLAVSRSSECMVSVHKHIFSLVTPAPIALLLHLAFRNKMMKILMLKFKRYLSNE